MTEKRRGLGRGLGALIPSAPPQDSIDGEPAGPTLSRPVDLFFPEAKNRRTGPRTVSRETSGEADAGANGSTADGPAEPKGTSTGEDSPAGSTDVPSGRARGSRNGAVIAQGAAAHDVQGDVSRETAAEEPAGGLVAVPGATFAEIPVGNIHPNRKQPRSVFDTDEMAELVHSVQTIGILQPIVVRRSPETGGEPYELVMGERRWRASQQAGLETVPAIIRETADDDLLRDALLENLHRSQLNPLEEAAAYQQLLEDFGTTHEQLADRIGRSRPQVSNTLRLLRLPALVQARVASGVISAGHARALLGLPDSQAMERVAQRVVSEGMSVRSTEEAVAMYREPEPGRAAPKPSARHERLDFLADSLSDRLDTNVKITLGARKGKVSIEFASVEDLNRIMDVLGPGATSN
jgi:ParB family chromosome partitioning protein